MSIVDIIKYVAKQHGIEHVDFLHDVNVTNDGFRTYISKWNLPFKQPTDTELQSLEPIVIDLINSEKYIDQRKSEYPSIQDQLDMLYWDKVNGTNNWQAKITEIKEKYPKS